MDDKKRKTIYTVDHSNKQSDAFGFDPYEFWLRQAQRSEQEKLEAKQSKARRETEKSTDQA